MHTEMLHKFFLSCLLGHKFIFIDDRSEMIVLQCPQTVTISNPDLLSRSGTGVHPGIRSFKKHLSE
jgi:hypothetical protein